MIETRCPLNGPGATADMGKAVHGMGSYHLGRSTWPVMPGADEGNMPGAVPGRATRQRRETVGNLSAGAWCPGPIEGLN